MEITSEQLKNKINNGEKVIIDFWAEFCSPCKIMKPTFEKVSSENNNANTGVLMYTFDVMKNQDYAVELGIRSIPTIKMFSNGKETYTKTGIHTEPEIRNLVKELTNG